MALKRGGSMHPNHAGTVLLACLTVAGCGGEPRAGRAIGASELIVFDARRTGADGPDEIYLINPDGSEIRQLTETPPPYGSGYPRWSPERSRIASSSANAAWSPSGDHITHDCSERRTSELQSDGAGAYIARQESVRSGAAELELVRQQPT